MAKKNEVVLECIQEIMKDVECPGVISEECDNCALDLTEFCPCLYEKTEMTN